MSKAKILLLYSGGSLNVNPVQSLGGPAGTEKASVAVSQSVISSGVGSITGVYVLGGNNVPVGAGSLLFNHSAQTLMWTDSSSTSTTIPVTTAGYYVIPYNANPVAQVWLYVAPDLLPAQNELWSLNVQPKTQNMLRNVSFSERSSGVTVYRGLYLKNLSSLGYQDVTISVDVAPIYGTLQVGSEYATGTQDSDGVSMDLQTAIAAETDPGNLLAGISWAGSWNCGTILPGKFASFWVRYNLPAGVSGGSQVDENFSLQVSYRRG